ncbi:LuxR C-terminal-related transcriptional regulator [Aquimarina algiphila]|uniref:Response regulator transcription factor n=1 Tax=Aquimarina algiphila TaxID=2047982 RepID=A0A554VJG6_9FLAO|nr:LuxR C-terminal-related transcriptional regulator [Aquimarina algiphila]TSE08051.1 response regulator transcription factor [Aquimarina algiphila]
MSSPRTVENYRDSIFKKLNVRTRVRLAVYDIENGYTNKDK